MDTSSMKLTAVEIITDIRPFFEGQCPIVSLGVLAGFMVEIIHDVAPEHRRKYVKYISEILLTSLSDEEFEN